MRKTRDMRNSGLKQPKLPSEGKRDDPTLEASILSLYSASQDARKHLVVCASGSLKGVKASSLARACEATHEYIDSPMEFHRGEDDQSEAAVSDEASPKEAKAT
jgi:hypothetical protein